MEINVASKLPYDGGLTCAMSVKDLPKALAWYQDVLGFEVLYHLEHMGWAEMKTAVPGVNVGLSQVEKKEAGGGGATLTWGVKDIAAARKTLEAKAVRFDGETYEVEGMVKLATFYDLDGNALMLYQDLAKK
jgi:catechol 2,3-dioxygenase-like lactoylglutathione lyase family enzyme